ncbi:glycosyltransferase family 2 protein [Candidatus Poribacteria bacterium]|nr:glycosyltransferase family 2 protein [Candidatus Poribacteria bacterium]
MPVATHPSQEPLLSVIIPAFNEEQRLPATLASIQDFLSRARFSWEIIVVDDGSRDDTIGAATAAFRDERCRVLPNPRNMGKGASIRNGMLAARGKYRLFTDADNSTPIEEAPKLLARMKRERADVAIGSRAVKGACLEVRQPLYREFMGRVFNLIVQVITLPGIKDTQCGFKIFTARAAKRVFPKQEMAGFSFDVEVLFLARRARFRIVEVPVRWINSPASRVSPIRDSAKMFADVVRIRLKHL